VSGTEHILGGFREGTASDFKPLETLSSYRDCAFTLSQNGYLYREIADAGFWAAVAFAKRLEVAEQILTTLNEELTKEQIEKSIQILDEVNQNHPEMLGG